MNKFRHHKYTWSKPFTAVHHTWELVGPSGGVTFNAFTSTTDEPICGLELHYTREAWLRTGHSAEAPHHLNCHVIHEPCWHDGTSLYATETLWPEIQELLKAGKHEDIFKILEAEYENRFKECESKPSTP